MMKRSFFGLAKPRFAYDSPDSVLTPERIPTPKKATIYYNRPYRRTDALLIKPGDAVKTGQKLSVYADDPGYAISPVTGAVAYVSAYQGDFGAACTAIHFDVAETEEIDDAFARAAGEATLETLKDYLAHIPGNPPLEALGEDFHPRAIVINAMDPDLLVLTNQQVARRNAALLTKGVSILKSIAHGAPVVVAMPKSLSRAAGGIGGASGAEARLIDDAYPAGLPVFVLKEVLGEVVPAGKTPLDIGVAVFTAEAVAGIAKAFETKQIPVTKTLTLIKKDLSQTMVEARIGTPLKDIFAICGVTLEDRDRIIIGGPMTGATIYSDEYPVGPDTDAVMAQDSGDVSLVSDQPCTNCGECVRICPANIAVNMLVRFCEARQYETAADEYDLRSCVECGLCTFVCPSRIPIFQYLRLAKYELNRLEEEMDKTAVEAETSAEETEETAEGTDA